MTDTYRDSFSNRYDDERNGDPGARWRRGEDRYRREASAQGDHRFDEDRYQDNRRNRDFGQFQPRKIVGGIGQHDTERSQERAGRRGDERGTCHVMLQPAVDPVVFRPAGDAWRR